MLLPSGSFQFRQFCACAAEAEIAAIRAATKMTFMKFSPGFATELKMSALDRASFRACRHDCAIAVKLRLRRSSKTSGLFQSQKQETECASLRRFLASRRVNCESLAHAREKCQPPDDQTRMD